MKLIILLYFCNAKDGSPTISCMALRHQITHLLGDEFRFVNDGTCTVECTYVWYPLFPQHNFWGNCRAIQLRAIQYKSVIAWDLGLEKIHPISDFAL